MEIPENALNRLARGTVKPGEVYRMKLTREEGITPKNPGDESRNKYFIVMGTKSDGSIIGVTVINSEVNRNIPKLLQKYHYPISADKYPFLEKDRYVCCNRMLPIKTEKFFSSTNKTFVGTIDEVDLEIIRAIMADSGLIPVALMREFDII